MDDKWSVYVRHTIRGRWFEQGVRNRTDAVIIMQKLMTDPDITEVTLHVVRVPAPVELADLELPTTTETLLCTEKHRTRSQAIPMTSLQPTSRTNTEAYVKQSS